MASLLPAGAVSGPMPVPRAVVVAALLGGLCLLVEGVLLGADLGLWGNAGWRPRAYQNGAFWAGLLRGWRPNYEGQAGLMFLTHAFLHAGPVHLAGNLGALGALAWTEGRRMGPRTFAALYLASALGGGAAFGLLATSAAPMVGASGAIFGLAGAAGLMLWGDRHARGLRGWAALWPTLAAAGALVLVNAATFALQGGQLAWEAHLGGWLAGTGFAALRTRM